jgi:hypothetical protein
MNITTAKAALVKATALYFNSDPVGPVELDRRRTAYQQARVIYDIALALRPTFVNRGSW